MGKFIDLTGKVFGRLTVIRRSENSTIGKVKWLCKCLCGNEKSVTSNHLQSGHTKSCGCFHTEQIKKATTRHGMRHSLIYSVWSSMVMRCTCEKDQGYKYYGARGITVCDKWLTFNGFYEDMKIGYEKGLTLDRKDVNGNYEPLNCKWVTMKEQCNNRRDNHNLTYNGKTQTISQWADELGINQGTLYSRLNRGHWSIERALTTK